MKSSAFLSQQQVDDLLDDFSHRLLISAPDDFTRDFIAEVISQIRTYDEMTSDDLEKSFRRAIHEVVLFIDAQLVFMKRTDP